MCAPCVFAIVDRYIAVSLEFYMDEGVSRRSSLNLGHLVDKGRGHTSSPHVLPCVCQIRDRTRVSSYLSLRARIIFIDSFLRKLPRDASWRHANRVPAMKCRWTNFTSYSFIESQFSHAKN